MPPFINHLPPELLETIFECNQQFFRMATLIQCQLTCKYWAHVAQKTMYRDITIKTHRQLAFFVRTISTSSLSPGTYTKQFYITAILDSQHEQIMFNHLVKHCPRLESIKVARTNTYFWFRLMHEVYDGRWKYLNTLQHPREYNEYTYYNYTVLAMRKNIKKVKIHDPLLPLPNTEHNNFQQNILMSRLNELEQLTNLTISSNKKRFLYEYDNEVNACPLLLYCKIELHRLSPFQSQDYQYHHTLPMIKPHFKMHTLEVTKPICDENTMIYIMTKFPNLKKISLGDEFSQIQLDLTQSRPMFSQQVLNRFACYLQGLNSYLVLNLFAENMSDVVRILTGTALDVYFTVNHESQEPNQLCAILSKTGTSVYENGMHLKSKCNNYTLPHLQVISKAGDVLHRLKIKGYGQSASFAVGQNGFNQMILGYYLDIIFKSCSQLKKLTLVSTALFYCNPDASVNNSIEILELEGCFYHPKVLKQLSVRLPDLKVLKMERCSLSDYGNLQVIDRRNNVLIDMPYTDFTSILYDTDICNITHYFCLRISVMKKEKYFRCDKDSIKPSFCSEYRKSFIDREIMTIHIKCKHIGLFTLRSYCGIYKIRHPINF